jgi:hypothetical protein
MYSEGQPIKVKKAGKWVRATFGEVAPDQPKRVDNAGVNAGRGYAVDQAWVVYEDGTSGLHPIVEEIRPADYEP